MANLEAAACQKYFLVYLSHVWTLFLTYRFDSFSDQNCRDTRRAAQQCTGMVDKSEYIRRVGVGSSAYVDGGEARWSGHD